MPTPQMRDEWDISVAALSLAYAMTPDEVQQMAYALSEQVHDKYCLAKGAANHTGSRPDEHIAMAILKGLVVADWFLTRQRPDSGEEPQDDAPEG